MIKNKFNQVENLLIFIKKEKILFLFLIIIFFLRFPSFLEPLRNGPESLYLLFAGKFLPLNYFSFLEFPPALFAQLAVFLFGNSTWSIRFLLTVWILSNITFFYFFSKNLLSRINQLIVLTLLTLIFVVPSELGFTLTLQSFLLLPFLNLILIVYKIFNLKNNLSPKFFLIISSVFLVVFFIYGKSNFSLNYYPNFAAYFSGKFFNNKVSEDRYIASFGAEVVSSYDIAGYLRLKTTSNDSIYVLGNLFSVYSIASRKPASEFVSYDKAKASADKTVDSLNRSRPKYLAVENPFPIFPPMDRLIKSRYNRFAQIENVTLYRLK